ncbi:MAG: 2-oxoacid:acceptor oxidoreductase family protein, partial [Clostridia bacterium]|nr:2-oxoacid:acceptor oxidoreductase family protein [Clostridia bacterium]
IYVDSTLIERKVQRDDVTAFYIPATQMASDSGLTTLANMIIVGKVIRESKVCAWEGIEDALKKVVSARHADLLGANLKALEMGYRFEG